jgi:hypothetical protein
MGKIKKMFFGLFLSTLLLTTGCKKCLYCSTRVTSFICFSGADTVGRITYGLAQFNDTVNYYHTIGYQCDSGFTYYNPNLDASCGTKKELQRIIDDGDLCQANPF